MRTEQFEEVINNRIETCKSVLCSKAEEYATDDRLHNFKVAGKLQKCTAVKALGGMMAKHTVSVYDLIDDYEQGEAISKETWAEKIGDSINYLLLLTALLAERNIREEVPQDDTVDYCYNTICNWVYHNAERFAQSLTFNNEIWGKIENGVATINKYKLVDFLQDKGYDYGSVMPKFAERGYIIRNSQGKYVHQTKVRGWKASYIKLKLTKIKEYQKMIKSCDKCKFLTVLNDNTTGIYAKCPTKTFLLWKEDTRHTTCDCWEDKNVDKKI